MKNLHLLMNEAEEGNSGASKAPDISKVLEENFKALNKKISDLDSRVSAASQPPKKAAKQEPEEEEDRLEDLILVNPAKAVKKITASIEDKVLGKVNASGQARASFEAKFAELQSLYPELANPKSELYGHAKELMVQSQAQDWDTGALERSVLRAAAEKGVVAMQHRKRSEDQEDEDVGYLGSGGSSGEGGSRERRRNSKNDKLPAASLAFAEAVGLDVKDQKLVDRLTKIHNERKGNWNRYR